MATTPVDQLRLIDRAMRALTAANTVEDVKEIRDQAEAFRNYARSATLGLEAQNRAAEVKLRAERKAGQFLQAMKLHGGDRKSNGHEDSLKLAELGISQNQSSRWQRAAAISEKVFEEYLAWAQEQGLEITSQGLKRFAKRANRGATSSNKTKNVRTSARQRKSVEGALKNSVRFSDCIEGAYEVVTELGNHHGLLVTIIGPLLDGNGATIRRAEMQHARHLLDEMAELIRRLQRNEVAHAD